MTWQLDPSHAVIVRAGDAGLELEPAVADGTAWCRAVAGDGTATALTAALADGLRPPPGFRLRTIAPLPRCGSGERAITADQTNESVIVADRLVVKWFPRPGAGPHPAPALLEHLAQVGFARMPTPHAAVYAGEALLALIAGYLPNARDGWDWCVDDLLAEWDYGQRAFFPEQLGWLAADLHAALATPSDVFPAPVGEARPDDIAAWAKQAVATMDTAITETPGQDGAWVRGHAASLRDDATVPALDQTPVLRIHGDLHVGQVMRWRGGLAITDFDGNPAVTADGTLQPAARDVAQLMTSLAHVAAVADKRTGWRRTAAAHAFAARAADQFLAAYRTRLAGHGKGAIFDDRLLRAFAVEQEARELVYAARFLPRWTYAPMSVLRSWYPPG